MTPMTTIHIDQDTIEIAAAEARTEAQAKARAEASMGAAIIRAAGDRIMFRLRDGQKFYIEGFPGLSLQTDGAPMDAETLKTAAGRYGEIVNEAVRSMNKYLDKAQAVNNDRDLSSHGRANALAKPQKDVTQGIAYLFNAVRKLQDGTLADEVALFAVPPVKAAHEATLDVEVRTWWRGLSMEARAQEMQRLLHDPAGHDTLQALMRSPIPLSSSEMLPVAEIWREGKRSVNPERSMKIDTDKEAAEWALAALRMCAAVTINVVGMKASEVLQIVLQDGDTEALRGAEAFGTLREIVRAKMLLRAAAYLG